MFGLGVVMEYCFHGQLLTSHSKVTWEVINAVDYTTIPIFFGIAVYIFEGIGLVIDMEKSMKKPEHFQVLFKANNVGRSVFMHPMQFYL